MRLRRTLAALLTTLLTLVGVAALSSTAQAETPGACGTGRGGPMASATCNNVPPGTVWQVQVVCFYVVQSQPITYWVAGNTVVGDGTSTAVCHPGDTATDTIRPVVIGMQGKQGRLVGYGGKCVDIAHGSNNNATPVQIYDCNGTGAQWWTLGLDNTVRGLGKCLNVVWGSASSPNGTKVEIYDCVGSQGEQWIPQPDGSLKNVLTGKCLDELGFDTSNRAQLGIWDCNGLANQKWVLTP
ncbi:RICIN domain-containing protein [Kitasatospora aureofaciens]|uniref:RICIN domain-containing protein n=1 Tax=Kitasatospora aureofaciens TaxID=1894 RepID=UPI000A546A01|nr:RICIN domain-containing protein [Kitasatospora aureofaciens]